MITFMLFCFQSYASVFAEFTTSGKSELILIQRVQDYCYDNMNFMKVFQKIIMLFYKGKYFNLIWQLYSTTITAYFSTPSLLGPFSYTPSSLNKEFEISNKILLPDNFVETISKLCSEGIFFSLSCLFTSLKFRIQNLSATGNQVNRR